MTDHVVARLATAEDLTHVVALANAARTESETERGGHLLFDLTHASVGRVERYEAIMSNADQIAVAGCVGDAVVGYATARTERGTGELICVLDELFVHPNARTVGVGATLLAATQDWAAEQGCTYVESQVLPGNRAAKNFFERVGMVTRAMRVSAPLAR